MRAIFEQLGASIFWDDAAKTVTAKKGNIKVSVAAFMLYNYGLRRLSSGTAVALMNLVPIFGVLFSTLFLHEVLHIFDLIGGLIIIVGVFLSVREK